MTERHPEGQIQQKAIEEYRQRIRTLEAHLNSIYSQTCEVEKMLLSPKKISS